MTRFMDFIIFQSQRDYRPSSPHVVLTTDRNSTGETETGHTNAFIFILLWMDGWTNRQAVKVTKNYINVILLTFLSIKSKTISAIAKHIIRLGHHYYRSLCTHTYPVFVALYSMFGHLETSPVGERSLVQSGLIRSQRCGGGVGWVMLTALNWHQDWLSSVALLAIDGFRKSDGVCLIKHCAATT